jgi:hypothetical protein
MMPDWDTAVPGKPPALVTPVTEAEIAAVRKRTAELASSLGVRMMSEREQWHASAISRAEFHRANLEFFLASEQLEQAEAHKAGLVAALIDMGEFDRAAGLAAGQRERIAKLKHAVERDDDEVCSCERETDQLAHPVHPNGPKANVELRRRHELGWVFSKKHGKVVSIWACRHCGDWNAHDQVPEGHAGILAARSVNLSLARANPNLKAHSFPHAEGYSDHALLRK